MSPRQDARRNRDRIVTAAAEVFRDHGATAPLGLVAERAGVGRATLYRHFSDRRALAAAVLDRRVTALATLGTEHPGPDLLDHLLVAIWTMQSEIPGLVEAARNPGTADLPEAPVARTRAMLEGALVAARRHGVVAPEVGLAELYLSIAMVDGVIAVRDKLPEGTTVADAMVLALRALRGPGGPGPSGEPPAA